MEKKVILVLDKLDYKKNENIYLEVLKNKFEIVNIVYTEYEDDLIRKVRNWKYIGSLLQHILYWKKSLDYAKKISKEKGTTVICVNPIVGIFLGQMNKSLSRNIIMCGFLFEPKNNKFYYALRKLFVKNCLKGIKYAIVYAQQEVDYYNQLLSLDDKFRFVQYGIDYINQDEYTGVLREAYIFSGGGSNRDYKTLVDAYNTIPVKYRPELCIATMPRCLEGLDTKRIHVLTDVVLETFGDVMKKSKCLILSLKDTEISAGHQVMLEALKNNVPIIVNRIKAVEDYVTDEQVTFYESGNKEMLAQCIIEQMGRKNVMNTSDFYEQKYTFQALLKRLLNFV